MKSTYFFNPISVRDSMFRKDVLEWGKIYNLINHAVNTNDRTQTLKLPIHQSIYDKCVMPAYATTNMSYQDCCDEKVKEIYELSVRLNKPIGIMWSGGIDSTGVVVSFLRNYSIDDLRKRIKIIMSSQSIPENPKFYMEYILPNFPFVNSETTPWLFDGSMILVSGEFNDQLFGSDMIRSLLISDKESVKRKLDKDYLLQFVNKKIGDLKISRILCDAIYDSSDKHGIVLEKNSDWFWWFNFCFKWQNVHFRIYCLTMPKNVSSIDREWDKTYLHHFYQTDSFQLWSMNNPQVREFDDWKDYKLEAKKLIFDFNKDELYYQNKIKSASLQNIFKDRILNECVTDKFEIVESFNAEEFYNRDNSFNL